MNKIKVFVCGDCLNQTTGLSYVISSIMKRMYKTDKFEIMYGTLSGEPTTSDGIISQGEEFYNIFKNMNIVDINGYRQDKLSNFDKAVDEFKPDIVLTLSDPWMLEHIAASAYLDSFQWVAYLPIEVPEYPTTMKAISYITGTNRKNISIIMSKANKIIPYTAMGYDMLTKKWGLDNVSEPCLNGVDFKDRHVGEITKKNSFIGACNDNDFIFMTMGINSERKRLDKVIEAFYKFKLKNKDPKYKLYMHTDINSMYGGTDLITMIKDLKIEDSVIAPPHLKAGKGMDKRILYTRYAACDCYISLPSGEGFSYGYAEAMMHGKPIIYIDYGGHLDYCKDAGIPVPVKDYVYGREIYVKWGLADTDKAVDAMNKVISDTKNTDRLKKNALHIAETVLDWDVVYPKFERIMLENYDTTASDFISKIGARRII